MSNVVGKAVGGSKIHLKMLETSTIPATTASRSRSIRATSCPPIRRHRADHREGSAVGVGGHPEPAADSGDRRRPVPALHAAGAAAAGRRRRRTKADIQLPNINCPKCTLQVIQFMAEHGYNQPGGYSYHHCADLQITADPAKPIDKGWPVAQ